MREIRTAGSARGDEYEGEVTSKLTATTRPMSMLTTRADLYAPPQGPESAEC